MNQASRGDVRIAGSGMVATGRYRTVSVSGSAVLSGDIDCVSLKVSGSAEGEGTLKTETVTVHGSLGYRGDAEAGSVRVSGTATFGRLKARDIGASGAIHARELTAETVKVQGGLYVDGDCEAERFLTQGEFSVGGLLNAGVVDVAVYGKCSAREIGGETVVVRTGMGTLKRLVTSLIPGLELRLTVETIEGDDVRLERTTAETVRGKSVVIGSECDIGLVEYTGTYSASPDAKVRQVRKVGEADAASDPDEGRS